MLIVCPQCVTSYQLDAGTIGAGGRSVRCMRCRHVWFVPPVAGAAPAAPQAATADSAAGEEAAFRAELGGDPGGDPGGATEPATPPEPAAAEPPAAETAAELEAPPLAPQADAETGEAPSGSNAATAAEQPAPALSDITIPGMEAPPLAPGGGEAALTIAGEREDVESAAARRRPREGARRRKSKAKLPLPLLIAALMVACAALIGWRKDIVRHAPQMASLYSYLGLTVNLRGLAFTDVKISSETHDGVPVLAVEGTIVNTVSTPVEVPRLRFAVRNAAGLEIYSWTAVPTQSVLEPSESLPFRSRLASPPADAHDVQVRFFNRRDAVAGVN